MKRLSCIVVTSIMLILCLLHLACSVEEERDIAGKSPALAPATQAAERIQQSIDPVALKAQQVSTLVQHAAEDSAALGVPGAGIVALIATAVGSILGVYNERRRGTVPMKDALTQVVQSVEAAFPSKTEQQKSILASKQDKATRDRVSQIKGS